METKTTWLAIEYGDEALGVLELAPGAPGKLELVSQSDAAKRLTEKWTKLSGKDGIVLKMHLPPENGEGRGPLGARVFRPGSSDYAMAVKVKLSDADFEVAEVQAWSEAQPPTPKELMVSRSGEQVGSVRFGAGAPMVELSTDKSDGAFLKSHVERALKQSALHVWYRRVKSGGGEELVHEQAKAGDPSYPRVFRLHLILNQQYDEKRGYELVVKP